MVLLQSVGLLMLYGSHVHLISRVVLLLTIIGYVQLKVLVSK